VRNWVSRTVLLVCLLPLCAALAGCGNTSTVKQATSESTRTARQAPTPPVMKPKAVSLRALVARDRSGVLRIEVDTCDDQGVGTGFLLSPRLVATVQHVVDGVRSIRLVRGGTSLGTATVIGSDSSRDLALLRTSRPISGYHFSLEKRAPALGEDVAVLGFPLGLPLSVSKGLVSGSDRTIPIEGIKRRKLIQTDAAVNRGNSGGPLLSLDSGQVVGLIDIGTTAANGLAFAVSSRVARGLLDAWAASPQPVAARNCGGSTPGGTEVATGQPKPKPASPVDAAAVEAAINTHWELINAGNYEAAYDYFSPSFRARVSRQGWIDDKLRDQPSAYGLRFLGVSGRGDEADVSVEFETSGLETAPGNNGCNDWRGTYHMVMLDSRWLIDSSHLTRTSC
jgi:serine protease Do